MPTAPCCLRLTRQPKALAVVARVIDNNKLVEAAEDSHLVVREPASPCAYSHGGWPCVLCGYAASPLINVVACPCFAWPARRCACLLGGLEASSTPRAPMRSRPTSLPVPGTRRVNQCSPEHPPLPPTQATAPHLALWQPRKLAAPRRTKQQASWRLRIQLQALPVHSLLASQLFAWTYAAARWRACVTRRSIKLNREAHE